MVTCKTCDYLTLSFIPDNADVSFDVALDTLLDTLFLRELLPSFNFKCSTLYYEQILRFSDIQIKFPYADKYKVQGFGLELSGNGLDYYTEYLRTKHHCDLRYVLKRLVSYTLKGYKIKCSRFDVAFDEILRKSDRGEALLNLERIKQTTLSGLVVSRLRTRIPELFETEIKSFIDDNSNNDDSVVVRVQTSLNPHTGEPGTTVYFGQRGGNFYIRFYDKLQEQINHKGSVDENIKHWVRFEMQLRDTNATAAFMLFVRSDNDKKFTREMRSRASNALRFVNLDRSRIYNCSVCSWWLKFLKKAKPKKFTHYKPTYNKFVRAVQSQKRQNAATLAAIAQLSPKDFIDLLRVGFMNPSKNAAAVKNDYNILKLLPPEEQQVEIQRSLESLSGFEFLRSFTDDNKDEFRSWLEKLFSEVFPNEAVEVVV